MISPHCFNFQLQKLALSNETTLKMFKCHSFQFRVLGPTCTESNHVINVTYQGKGKMQLLGGGRYTPTRGAKKAFGTIARRVKQL